MKNTKLNSFTILICFIFKFSFSQDVGILTGRVVDSKTLFPLQGATILIEGESLGTISDENGNTIPHEDEITEMKSNPDYKGVGAVKDKSQVQKPDSTTVIAPYGQKLGKDEMKKALEFAKKDVPYQDSKGGHTLLIDKGKVKNLKKINTK